MAATAFETYKAQADVLVPVVRALLTEIGVQRTQQLVSHALADHFRNLGSAVFAAADGADFGSNAKQLCDIYNADGTFEIEYQHQDQDHLDINVTKCGLAEVYRDLNATELGFLTCCGTDYALTEGMDENAVLQRPTTLMQGHSSCQFHWSRRESGLDAQMARNEELASAATEQLKLLDRALISAPEKLQ